MSYYDWLSTTDIHDAFSAEIQAAGGTVLDAFDDGCRLFARSTLPRLEEVRPHDKLQGGVALRATETEVWVHPYVYRLVCRNGAIAAHALESRCIKADDVPNPEDAIEEIRETVRACSADDVFMVQAGKIRAASSMDVTDAMLNMMAVLAHLPPRARDQIMQSVLDQYASAGDSTRYGLMNAVTATARDTRDPDLRWRLEELGGSIPALRPPKSPRGNASLEMQEELLLECVGSSARSGRRLIAS
jgi:hypothetical protein